MRFAKPTIVNSTFDKGKLAIAYPYVEDGEWIHREELKKELENIIKSLPWETIKGEAYMKINDLTDKLKLWKNDKYYSN